MQAWKGVPSLSKAWGGEREAYEKELVVGGAAKGRGGGELLKCQWLWVWVGDPLQVEKTSASNCRREPRAPQLYRWWLKSAGRQLSRVRGSQLWEVEENGECQGHTSPRREFSGPSCRRMDGGRPALPGFAQQNPLQPVESPFCCAS